LTREAEADWDRFLIRFVLSGHQNFTDYISVPGNTILSRSEPLFAISHKSALNNMLVVLAMQPRLGAYFYRF